MPRVRRCKYPNCHAYAVMPNHYCQTHIDHEQEYLDRRNKYHESKQTRWKYNHVTRYRNSTKAKQNKFYHTRVWKNLRKVVLQRDYHLCRYCLKGTGTIVDHIVPVEFDINQIDNVNNLVTCCRDCHAKKTRWEQKYYGTGLHNQIKPVPEITDIKTISKLMNAPDGHEKPLERFNF